MLTTIEGIYKDGVIELTELPEGITESQVIVTFMAPKLNQLITFGMLAAEQSTESDFKDAEFHDDPDDTPISEIKASLTRALQDVKAGRVRPISELWNRIDAE